MDFLLDAFRGQAIRDTTVTRDGMYLVEKLNGWIKDSPGRGALACRKARSEIAIEGAWKSVWQRQHPAISNRH